MTPGFDANKLGREDILELTALYFQGQHPLLIRKRGWVVRNFPSAMNQDLGLTKVNWRYDYGVRLTLRALRLLKKDSIRVELANLCCLHKYSGKASLWIRNVSKEFLPQFLVSPYEVLRSAASRSLKD